MPVKLALRIDRALALHARLGSRLHADGEVRAALEALRSAAAARSAAMRAAGVGERCAACARVTPGGCCFPEIAEEFDEVQLLANLLLGAPLVKTPLLPGSCAFVGAHGCTLAAPQAFCLNYFCPALREALAERLPPLLAVIGAELQASFAAETALRRFLSSRRGGA
jgi:hypothetical protein